MARAFALKRVIPADVSAPPYARHMALKADEVYQAGLALDLDERTVLAHRLLASLHPEDDASQSETDDAWRDEIGSRVDDILNDRVELGAFEQTHDKARALLDDPRK
ncbi:MAG: addiction module protein [Microbacteriaceae bacterium]